MKFSNLALAAALALAGVSAPAFAQEAVVGAKIFGPDGAEVGTIVKVEGGIAMVDTGNLTAALPANTFGQSDAGLTIGWNKAELEEAVTSANQQAAAALATALVAGAEVYSADGQLVGKVKDITAEAVVIERAGGVISLPKGQMALRAEKLTFPAIAADIEAAVAAQGGD